MTSDDCFLRLDISEKCLNPVFFVFDECLMTTAAFASLSLAPALLQSLESLGYTEMTAIQQQSLPAMLSGKDVLGKAKTGSGKTAAFALGLLSNLDCVCAILRIPTILN